MADWGARAARLLDDLAALSEAGPGVTRLPYTEAHRAALDLLSRGMKSAGLAVTLDAAGSLVGRREGPAGAPTILMGSHQDSVREGGAFDGIMGVVLPLLALEKLREDGDDLAVAVEVLAFADEEGVRFPTALIGSRALAGGFDPAVLDMRDDSGTSIREVMTGFGLDPGAIPGLARDPGTIAGYIEVHIEQGPVLERGGEALGIVTAICGIERHQVTITGETGHSGTLPMEGRRDALLGAAAIVGEVNRLARFTPGLRGTVGKLGVAPNVVNAVPREVRLTAEFRAADDDARAAAGTALQDFARRLARDSGLHIDCLRSYCQPAQPCDPALSERLRAAAVARGARGLTLASGATHDASAMADLCPVAMLFLRCRGGISHHPDEHASASDMGLAVEVLADVLRGYDHGVAAGLDRAPGRLYGQQATRLESPDGRTEADLP